MVDLPSGFKEIELIVLDMDGVITSEEAYWDAAGLVVQDLLESPAFLGLNLPHFTPISAVYYRRLAGESRSQWRKYLPPDLILNCKARGINSNWDLAYLTAGLYLAPLFSLPLLRLAADFGPRRDSDDPPLSIHSQTMDEMPEENISDEKRNVDETLKEHLSPVWEELRKKVKKGEWSSFLRRNHFHLWGSYFRKQGRTLAPVKNAVRRIIDDFHPDIRGLRLLDELNTLLPEPMTHRWNVFGRKTELWEDCRDLFQGWYLGEELYARTYGHPLLYSPKLGLVHREEPLHGRVKTHACLSRLRETGFHLGIATGRPRMEIVIPLTQWNMIGFFDGNRIITHDEVETAEAELKRQGIDQNLGKPHPYAFLQAVFPEQKIGDLARDNFQLPEARKVLVVGDAPADIWAAQKLGCPCVALLSGAIGSTGRKQLEEAGPDVICRDVLELSESMISLRKYYGKNG